MTLFEQHKTKNVGSNKFRTTCAAANEGNSIKSAQLCSGDPAAHNNPKPRNSPQYI